MPLNIAIIGAGLAGLSAADRLLQLGADVTVFEARDRVGGRVYSDRLEDASGHSHVIERGAEYILSGYSLFSEMVKKFNLELIDSGMSYYVREPADLENYDSSDIVAAGATANRILVQLDSQASAEEVLQRMIAEGVNPLLVDALRSRIEISTAVGAEEVTAEALTHVASFTPGPSYRVAGGNQRLAIELAQQLGENLKFNTPVIRVENLPDGTVQVDTGQGGRFIFDAVVVAIPLSLLRDPETIQLPLPQSKIHALSRVIQGHAAKLHLLLKSVPETSAVMSVNGRYWTWTAQAAGGGVPPVMNAFMGSAKALNAADLENRSDLWASNVALLRPELDVSEESPVVTLWSQDPWARYAYAAHAPGNTPVDSSEIERPVGAVFYAGEYADSEFTGLMEGALRSGRRAADNILSAQR